MNQFKIKNILTVILFLMILVTVSGCSKEDEAEKNIPTSSLDGVVILQVYGTGDPLNEGNDPILSNSFIELYNPTQNDVILDGSTIQYSSGGTDWSYLLLNGTIKTKHSFLITTEKYGENFTYGVAAGDQVWKNMIISNKGIKVCLMDSTTKINVTNPSNVNGTPISNYIDMVSACATNETIDGAEIDFVEGQSKQNSVRRVSLVDTNNNSKDFTAVNYKDLASDLVDCYLPQNLSSGKHNPFEGIENMQESTNSIVILQVYGTGNNIDTPINRSFIELYNTTDTDINLSGYSIQYKYKDDGWLKLNLDGEIKAKSSYLIAGKVVTNSNDLNLSISNDDADKIINWEIDNKKYTICLVQNTNLLGLENPFYMPSTKKSVDGYIDMIGVDSDFYEMSPFDGISKQKTARRTSLVDTNNNSIDFEIIDFRLVGNTLTKEQLSAFAPRSSSDGSWKPFN